YRHAGSQLFYVHAYATGRTGERRLDGRGCDDDLVAGRRQTNTERGGLRSLYGHIVSREGILAWGLNGDRVGPRRQTDEAEVAAGTRAGRAGKALILRCQRDVGARNRRARFVGHVAGD